MNSLFLRRRRSLRALIVATVLVTGVESGTTFATASAEPLEHETPVSQGQSLPEGVPSDVKATFEKLEKNSLALKERFNEGDVSLTRRLIEKVRLSIANGTLTTHLPNGAKFDTESATTYIPKAGDGPTILRLPLTEGNLANPSVLGITFDPKTGALIFTTEMLPMEN